MSSLPAPGLPAQVFAEVPGEVLAEALGEAFGIAVANSAQRRASLYLYPIYLNVAD